MRYDKTVCEKVNEIEEEINRAVKTKEFDAVTISRLLYAIRSDAQKMENGLKLRKEIMTKAGLEDKYQKAKGKVKPDSRNKIANEEVEKIGHEDFFVTIRRQGKVVYAHRAYAGAVSLVEKVQDVDEFGTITGITQRLIFGHPLGYWFAFNQLEHYVRQKNVEILGAIGSLMKNGKMDKESRDIVMKALGKMNIKAGEGVRTQ